MRGDHRPLAVVQSKLALKLAAGDHRNAVGSAASQRLEIGFHVERDFSFVFDDSVEFEKIHQSVTEFGIAELRSFVPVEIFRGDKVGAAKYSILMRAMFQSSERTLRDDEVAQWAGQIAKALESLGGVQRA